MSRLHINVSKLGQIIGSASNHLNYRRTSQIFRRIMLETSKIKKLNKLSYSKSIMAKYFEYFQLYWNNLSIKRITKKSSNGSFHIQTPQKLFRCF